MNIPIPDMIHLHQEIGDILFIDLLKATLKLSKLQTIKSRIENQLRQEKVENKSHQAQINKLQTDLLAAKIQANKGAGIQKLLNEKENGIYLLEKKFKIPPTQWIHAPELAGLEKEKEGLSNELTDCKDNLIKFAEKKNSDTKT